MCSGRKQMSACFPGGEWEIWGVGEEDITKGHKETLWSSEYVYYLDFGNDLVFSSIQFQ